MKTQQFLTGEKWAKYIGRDYPILKLPDVFSLLNLIRKYFPGTLSDNLVIF